MYRHPPSATLPFATWHTISRCSFRQVGAFRGGLSGPENLPEVCSQGATVTLVLAACGLIAVHMQCKSAIAAQQYVGGISQGELCAPHLPDDGGAPGPAAPARQLADLHCVPRRQPPPRARPQRPHHAPMLGRRRRRRHLVALCFGGLVSCKQVDAQGQRTCCRKAAWLCLIAQRNAALCALAPLRKGVDHRHCGRRQLLSVSRREANCA